MSGRYQEPSEVIPHLSGKDFNLPVHYAFPISLSDSSDTQKSFLPEIWAKQATDQHTIREDITILLPDANGQIFLRKTFIIEGQTARIKVSLPESTHPGPYCLVVYAGKDLCVEKVIKL